MEEFQTNVYVQNRLKKHIELDKNKNERFLVENLREYLFAPNNGKVCILYGLRRTGKTTMISHSILKMNESDLSKTAYISLSRLDTVGRLRNDLNILYKNNFKYVFIDEVTALNDFISVANIYSDVFAKDGMKIVLTGTDSLGFVFANSSSLYNRSEMIHTTFIPFYEFSHIFPNKTVDDYIEFGGTLVQENDHSNPFYSMKESEEYVDSAIAHNIQHSLECYENGRNFEGISELHNFNELTNVINRLIQRKNREFVVRIINKKFSSTDFGSTYQLLEQKLSKLHLPNPMDDLDKITITNNIMSFLEIFNLGYGRIRVTQKTVDQLSEYLKLLDLIQDYNVLHLGSREYESQHTLFLQSGLRYSQVKAMYDILRKDGTFNQFTNNEKEMILSTMDNDVKGSILEEIVLANTQYVMSDVNRVYKFIPNMEIYQTDFQWNDKNYQNGEFDMVIQDNVKETLSIFEIKHSSSMNDGQIVHLIDRNKISCLEKKTHLRVTSKTVLYLGPTKKSLYKGVQYKNVCEYLDELKVYDRNYQKMVQKQKEGREKVENKQNDIKAQVKSGIEPRNTETILQNSKELHDFYDCIQEDFSTNKTVEYTTANGKFHIYIDQDIIDGEQVCVIEGNRITSNGGCELVLEPQIVPLGDTVGILEACQWCLEQFEKEIQKEQLLDSIEK